MIRTLAVALATLILVACATPGKFIGKSKNNDCGGQGIVNSVIRYGDSNISVTPVSEVKRKGEIRFVLNPQRQNSNNTDYKEIDVAIEGKTGSDQWLNTHGKFVDKSFLVICVNQNQASGTYAYMVTVPGVGKIDPRVSVVD